MLAPFGPREDIPGAPVSPLNPTHISNWTQEPKQCLGPGSPRLRPPTGKLHLGSGSEAHQDLQTASVRTRVSAAGGGMPTFAPSPAFLRGKSVRKTGRSWGGRSQPRRRKQPPPQLRECGRGLPGEGDQSESFRTFPPGSLTSAPPRPTPPQPLRPPSSPQPTQARGDPTSAFKRRGHMLRPHLLLARQ